MMLDKLVKSPFWPFYVIPAEAGIPSYQDILSILDTRFRGYDDFLRDRS
jgi:hypothetical protein